MTTKLQSILSKVSGASFVSIDTSTTPKLAGGKSNPMQGKVRKITIGGNVIIFAMNKGSGYENMVNRRLVKEGLDPNSFTVGSRAWGQRIAGTPFIEHNGEMYLEVIFLHPGKTHYEFNGTPIAKQSVEGLPAEKSEGEQGGLSNKVIIRTFKTDSITAITIDGVKHAF